MGGGEGEGTGVVILITGNALDTETIPEHSICGLV